MAGLLDAWLPRFERVVDTPTWWCNPAADPDRCCGNSAAPADTASAMANGTIDCAGAGAVASMTSSTPLTAAASQRT
ncbi:hypothetical protein GCM10010359_50240 [Streptomyces morookaense]|nr:hypothetical protein GCM10010359_50240 [Streptomyces morookaense]